MLNCLACDNDDCVDILDFGLQPAANLLCVSPNEDVKRVRLALQFCEKCGHSQQAELYPREELFNNYLYQSGTTKTLSLYFDWFARAIYSESLNSRVLEIASNDGSFLSALGRVGLTADGVEPAKNLCEISRKKGLNVFHGFWPEIKLESKYDRIVAMNVLAHGPDPMMFLDGISRALEDDGIAYIQVSQADMFNNYEFDTLYHEHFSFFCPSSVYQLGIRAGFKKFGFLKTNIHGGSVLAFLGFENSPIENALSIFDCGEFSLGRLDAYDRPSKARALEFSKKALETVETILSIENLAKESRRKFVLVGAAAKAITVIQASGVQVDMVIDEAPLKISKYIPGTSMQIVPFEDCGKIEDPCVFLIGAWNFRDEIEKKLRQIRSNKNDLVVVYFPSVNIAKLHRQSAKK